MHNETPSTSNSRTHEPLVSDGDRFLNFKEKSTTSPPAVFGWIFSFDSAGAKDHCIES